MGPEHDHAECSPCRVQCQAAFRPTLKAEGELQSGVDFSTAEAPPGATDARHDSERCRRPIVRGPHSQGESSNRHLWRIEARSRQPYPLSTEQGDVGHRVAPSDIGGHRLFTRQTHRDLAVIGQGFIGRHDQALSPGEAARTRSVGVN